MCFHIRFKWEICVCDKIMPANMYLYHNLSRNWHWQHMGFTWVGPWNYPCKSIVLPHIGITWGLHWSTHETAHINHCLTTHWYYMGFTLVGPWNCTWKATVYPKHWHCMGFTLADSWNCPYKPLSYHTLVLHGVYSGWPMKLRMKSHCFFHTLALHGVYVVQLIKVPI